MRISRVRDGRRWDLRLKFSATNIFNIKSGLISCNILQWQSGWWFGTFSIFPYIGNNHPNWLIFFRGVQTTNQQWDFVGPLGLFFLIARRPGPFSVAESIDVWLMAWFMVVAFPHESCFWCSNQSNFWGLVSCTKTGMPGMLYSYLNLQMHHDILVQKLGVTCNFQRKTCFENRWISWVHPTRLPVALFIHHFASEALVWG